MALWFLIIGAIAGLMGYLGVAATAARRLTRWPRRQPPTKSYLVGLTSEDVWFKARGEALKLAAWHIPAPGATRAVIIAHGIGGCRGREYTISSLDLVKALVADGFTVLALDLRGHGESDAAPMSYGLHERRDVLGAVDWLLARGYAPGAIGVLGLSMGGVAGIGAAREEPAVGALILDSVCADYLPVLSKQFSCASRLPSLFLPGAFLIGRMMIGERLDRLRPVELLQAIPHRRVLVIHAEGDKLVPVAHAHALATAGAAELWLVGTDQHLGTFAANPQQYAQRVITFFDNALIAAHTPALAAAPRLAHRSVGGPINAPVHQQAERASTRIDLFRHTRNVRHFEPGSVIFREGEPGDSFYSVIAGEVEIRQGEQLVAIVGQGELLGELAMLDHGPHSASAVARTSCTLAIVDEQRFLYMVQHTPFFALNVMRTITERLRYERTRSKTIG